MDRMDIARWRTRSPHALVFAFAVLAVTLSPVTRAQGTAAPAAGAPVSVEARPAADVFVHPQRVASASVLARNESRIAAEVAARIVRIHVDAGQGVRRGAPLIDLDDVDFQLALDRLTAQREALAARVTLAQQQLRRARELLQQNFVSAEFVNQRDAEMRVLNAEAQGIDAQIATARRQIDKTRLRSPFDAIVRQRGAQLGELAAPGVMLFVLTETGAPEVSAAIAAEDAARIRQASRIVFETGEASYPVRVLRVAGVVTAATRTREGRLAFVGESALPGAEGTLRWDDPRPHLPSDALVRRDGRLGVFTLLDGIARFVPVAGAQEGRAAPTTIPATARIVVAGQMTLQDGQGVPAAR